MGRLFWPIGHRIDFMDPRDRLDKSKNFMERLGSLEYFLFVTLITKLWSDVKERDVFVLESLVSL